MAATVIAAAYVVGWLVFSVLATARTIRECQHYGTADEIETALACALVFLVWPVLVLASVIGWTIARLARNRLGSR